ncbi:MAG: voltage-gated potassium channel [Chloroflexota bacterium]|jgi:voltage-gated potassium channel|nr:voltage-gated potassium channel [Chloroflexota bacterium]
MVPKHTQRHPFRALVVPFAILLSLLVYGTVGYMALEHFTVLDAFYMTVSTISTVGFGEIHPLDTAGRAFTITVIVMGVAGFLYTFGVLIESVSAGRWQAHRRYRRMEAQLEALTGHVIVCGYGRTGEQVVRELEQAEQPYVVVEINELPLEFLRRDRRLHVVGDAASDDVLKLAGIDRAVALVTAVDSDERNVYIVLTARAINPELFIVARAGYRDSDAKLHRAGADRVVSPYTLSGRRMAALALQPAVVDVLDVVMTGGSAAMAIEELLVPDRATPGLTPGVLRRSGAVLLAVCEPDGAMDVGPGDSRVLNAGDLVIAMGTRDQLGALASAMLPT